MTISQQDNVLFPNVVRVRVNPQFEGLLAINLCFKMRTKNDFNFVTFVRSAPSVTISRDDLLEWFDQERALFAMDYVDPRSNFTHQILPRILNAMELEKALDTFRLFDGTFPYPAGYEGQLKEALLSANDEERSTVKVCVETDV
jgi:hypothetical protein